MDTAAIVSMQASIHSNAGAITSTVVAAAVAQQELERR